MYNPWDSGFVCVKCDNIWDREAVRVSGAACYYYLGKQTYCCDCYESLLISEDKEQANARN